MCIRDRYQRRVHGDKEEPSNEFSFGLGTKAFASPEQMSGSHYDQKSDVYSLGLVLIALFYPTKTVSELFYIIQDSREKGCPAPLRAQYPELAELLHSMIRTNPTERPSAAELADHSLFGSRIQQSRYGRSYSHPSSLSTQGAFFHTRLGERGKWKRRYLKITKNSLLVYKHQEDSKAQYSYPLTECIVNQGIGLRGASDSSKSLFQAEEAKALNLEESAQSDLKENRIAKIEHEELESLHLMVEKEDQRIILSQIAFVKSHHEIT
eukprot:TRINITY_DN2556_c0_g1_i4.p1 TRINITY_DN2556_c0_g1~~TRINITY_DN2556_c0_g1_i4.p1  ORF type:complete len:266 (-),score=49.34 TRINITY_DN2556_c0_g1_i4:161-958(-)